ncbi:MAG: adenylate/guanylate cyclase domain-containing protein [Cyclobacteriaceae bacterium]
MRSGISNIYGFRSDTISAILLLSGWILFGLVAYAIRYSHMKAVALPEFPVIWEYILPPLLVGAPLALFDTNILRFRLRRFSFTVSVLIRILIFGLSISLTYLSVGFFIHGYSGQTLGYYMLYFVMLWGTASVLLLAVRNLAEHFDRRRLFFWVTGAYHKPRVEERIFLFIDLNDSTSIAERLGPENYFNFLSSFFSLTARIIEAHHGEIYQHVGDEIIITWPVDEGRKNHRALLLFYEIEEAIDKHKHEFLKAYGVYPQVKGSLHAGLVTKGEILGKKREFIFTGDVLNATSRMQSLCKPNEARLIISDDLFQQLDLPASIRSESLGIHQLKGRERTMEVHRLERLIDECN